MRRRGSLRGDQRLHAADLLGSDVLRRAALLDPGEHAIKRRLQGIGAAVLFEITKNLLVKSALCRE